MNSDFKNHLVKADFDDDPAMFMRLIDWKRRNPYTYRMENWLMLEQSDMLFARKFSAEIDRDIIKKMLLDMATSEKRNLRKKIEVKLSEHENRSSRNRICRTVNCNIACTA